MRVFLHFSENTERKSHCYIFIIMFQALNPDFHHEHGGTTADSDSHHIVLWRSLLVVCSIYFFYLFHLFFCFIEVRFFEILIGCLLAQTAFL